MLGLQLAYNYLTVSILFIQWQSLCFNKNPQIGDLISVLDDYLNDNEVELVEKAHKLAEKAHKGQFRKSGESYIHSSIISGPNTC